MNKSKKTPLVLSILFAFLLSIFPAFGGGPLTLFVPGVPNAYGPIIGFPVPVFTDIGPLGPLTTTEADALTAFGFWISE